MARSVAAQIRASLKRWQKKLLLSDWTITVVVGKTDDGSAANCDAQPEYKTAVLTFDPTRIPVEQIDSFAVHELLHCHTWRLEAIAEEWGQSESRYQVVREVAETTVTSLEYAVLNVARK
jgi:hypothetical protein